MDDDLEALHRRIDSAPEDRRVVVVLARNLAKLGKRAEAYLLLLESEAAGLDPELTADLASQLAAEQRPALEALRQARLTFAVRRVDESLVWIDQEQALAEARPLLGLAIAELRSGLAVSDLAAFACLRSLCLPGDLAGAGALRQLEALPALRELWFFRAEDLADAELEAIARLTGLRFLSLDGTKISDPGLASLASLERLEDLDLSRTRISEAGLEALRALPRLRALHLHETSISLDEAKKALPRVSQILAAC